MTDLEQIAKGLTTESGAVEAREEMLLRAIVSQHTVAGMTNGYAVAQSAFKLGRAMLAEAGK